MSRELFKVERLPVLQNRTFANAVEAKASQAGDVVLLQDERTGLIFMAEFDPSLLRYDEDYQNEQACSPVFQKHLEDVATIIARHFKGQRLIEAGCGKGINPVDARVPVLGLAFKENCPDLRNTRVVDIVAELADFQAQVDVYDPWVNAAEAQHEYGITPITRPKSGRHHSWSRTPRASPGPAGGRTSIWTVDSTMLSLGGRGTPVAPERVLK